MRQMQRDHLAVLHAIERPIVDAYRSEASVDDAAVREALAAMLNRRDPTPSAERVFHRLAASRRQRNDVTDAIWDDGLRVVLQSVKNHSECRPGEVNYLEFVRRFT